MTIQEVSLTNFQTEEQWRERVAYFADPKNNSVLLDVLRGLEKESLRVTPRGDLAQTPHPSALGSALTHPNITTDYSEALLEFITEPFKSVEDLRAQLESIHQYTNDVLNQTGERIWPSSMPSRLGGDAEIPVARYGHSHSGIMKTIYREGLGHRYGRSMQTIAGIHYNFSLPDSFWAGLQSLSDEGKSHADLNSQELGDLKTQSLSDFKTTSYFGLIRNFRREFWWLIYLFGASPAVCECFVKDRPHKLQKFPDAPDTLYLPYATSLRMGDLGYQSDAQKALMVDYNQLNTYLRTLCGAITQSHPAYEKIGVKDEQGNYQQLNTSLLQIENEFYSSIRPKRTTARGETALQALRLGGVEYVEVRCVDLNPFEPLGINLEQMRVLDAFLLQAAMQPSPMTSPEEYLQIQQNQSTIVNRGREPSLALVRDGQAYAMQQWAIEIYERCLVAADLFDQAKGGEEYRVAVETQREKLLDSNLTPSAKILAAMAQQGRSFLDFTSGLADQHKQYFTHRPMSKASIDEYNRLAERSIEQQTELEQRQTGSIEEYLASYYEQYQGCQCAK